MPIKPASIWEYCIVLLALSLPLGGCLSPMALDRAVLSYNEATTDVLSRQLLVNIARARHHHPLHFTAVSNIAATFDFRFNAGATPALTGNSGGMLMPVFGGSVAENPTISIVPIEGEEFTRRLLTPFPDNNLTLLLRQGTDVDMVLRLLVGEWRARNSEEEEVTYANRPADRKGYALFRRVMTHLSTLQDRNVLYVEPLLYARAWELPADRLSATEFQSLQKDFNVEYDSSRHSYHLTRQVTGRIVITNYDTNLLSNAERQAINAESELSPPNEIIVDIRSGHVGGEYPLHGKLRLRSLHNVLNFIGRSIAEEPEYDVMPDPRTPPVSENPIKALAVTESEKPPEDDDLVVRYQDLYYAIRPEQGYQWNHEAFRLLYQLFQMTVTEVSQSGAPAITIAK